MHSVVGFKTAKRPDTADILSAHVSREADSTYLMAEAFAARARSKPQIGEWIAAGRPGEPIDYDPGHDSLLLVWDDRDAGGRAPGVALAPDPFDPEVVQVRVGGRLIAEVYGHSDLRASDIVMIPLSSAENAGIDPR